MQDRWAWRVTYTDGTTVDEHEGSTARGFSIVDITRAEAVAWLSTDGERPDYVVRIDAASGQRPILFRRRSTSINPSTSEQEGTSTAHVIGWQRTVHGTNVSSYSFIFDDGSALITDDFNAV